jgi:hypothetical protein
MLGILMRKERTCELIRRDFVVVACLPRATSACWISISTEEHATIASIPLDQHFVGSFRSGSRINFSVRSWS